MSRALHPLVLPAPGRPHLRAARRAAMAGALLIASACVDDPSVAPDDQGVRLAISAQVNGGRTVAIEISYRRVAGEGETLVRLESRPERVPMQPGTVQVPVTVNVAACIADPQRVRTSAREDACPLAIVLRLLGADDEELDSQRIDPEAAAPGETVTPPAFTLSEPELVLTPAALTFTAVERGPLPEPQHVAISNGGGGSLGAITVTSDESAAAWLQAVSVATAGIVSVQPTTTSLAPGQHTTTVLVHSAGVANSPRPVAVTYQIAAIPRHLLSVGATGDGSGRIISEPAGIDCTITAGLATGQCEATFEEGSLVFLDAEPQNGSTLVSWSEACEGDGGCGVTMLGARHVTATFARIPRLLSMTASGAGGGSVTSTPAGIACTIQASAREGECEAAFPHGTLVTLTAAPFANSVFVSWSGACSGSNATCTVGMTEARTVEANFALVPVRVDVRGAGTGTGTIISEPSGIRCTITNGVETGECGASFPHGTSIRLLATPDGASTFAGWSGACTGTGDCVLAVTAASVVTASFALNTYPLAVAIDGDGGGVVSSSPEGIVCSHDVPGVPADCGESYDHGTLVTLTAAPGSGSAFAGWGGACEGTAPCTVSMTAARSVTATFTLLQYSLTIRGGGNGNGRITGGESDIDCTIHLGVASGRCSAQLKAGTVISLDAGVDGEENEFLGWSGACTGTGPCTVTMTGNQEVTATIDLEAMLSVSVVGNVEAYVTSDPGAIACTIDGEGGRGTCEDTFAGGTAVTLTANTPEHAIFMGWDGDCEGTQPTCTLTIDGAKHVEAEFQSTLRFLSVDVVGAGSVVSNVGGISCTRDAAGVRTGFCVDAFPVGSEVVLTATPDQTTAFIGWSGACSGTQSTCTVTMSADLRVTATFQPKVRYTLTVRGEGTGRGWVRSEPTGIECRVSSGEASGTCAAPFDAGTTVKLTTSPDDDSEFVRWSTGACQGSTSPICDVAMTQNVVATAGIGEKPPPRYTLTIQGIGSGHGSVLGPPDFECAIDAGVTSGTCSITYDEGVVVGLTAIADVASEFTAWSGACTGTSPTSCSVHMTEDRTVTAGFSKSWTAMKSGTTQTLNAVDGWMSDHVFAVGASGTILHFDGETWSPMVSNTTATLNAVFVWNATTAYAVGTGGTVLRWDGKSWSRMATESTVTLYDVFGTLDGLFAVGEKGVILRLTEDTWLPISSGVTSTLRGIHGSSASWHTAVGAGGAVTEWNYFRWASDPGPSAQDLYDVWQPADHAIWTVGAAGQIAFSDGFKWTIVTPTTSRLTSIRGRNQAYIVAVGDAGTIYRYDGTSWIPMRSGTTRQLNGVWADRFSSSFDFFAVGASGTILRHTVP